MRSPNCARSPYPSQQMRAGKPWNRTFLARQMDPTVQNLVVGKQFQNQIIGDRDVVRISRQGSPSEGPSAFGKHRPNVRRNESRKVVGILHAAFESHRPDVVPVVEGDGAALLHIQHGLNVNGHRFECERVM